MRLLTIQHPVPCGSQRRGISNVKSAYVVPPAAQPGLSILEAVGRPFGEIPSDVGFRGRSSDCPKLGHRLSITFLRCWHMLGPVSRVIRRRQPGAAQRWFSASSSSRKQVDFSSTAEATVQENAESRPGSQTESRGARDDPSYEEWLTTAGRQYKRTDNRNWLGGSVVRTCVCACVSGD